MGNKANRGEIETDREKGLRRERGDIGGKRNVVWVDFDRWLKSTPEFFKRRQSNRTINISKIVIQDWGGFRNSSASMALHHSLT